MDEGQCKIIVPIDGIEAEDELTRLKEHSQDYPNNVLDSARIVIREDTIPEDRLFRNAWTDEYDTPTVDINIDKAKDIHMSRIREMRDRALEDSDKEFMVKLSKGEDTSNIVTMKNTLRDIPQTVQPDIENIKTVEELKAYWPEGLETHPSYIKYFKYPK